MKEKTEQLITEESKTGFSLKVLIGIVIAIFAFAFVISRNYYTIKTGVDSNKICCEDNINRIKEINEQIDQRYESIQRMFEELLERG